MGFIGTNVAWWIYPLYNNAIIVKMSLWLSHPYEPKSEWLLQTQYNYAAQKL